MGMTLPEPVFPQYPEKLADPMSYFTSFLGVTQLIIRSSSSVRMGRISTWAPPFMVQEIDLVMESRDGVFSTCPGCAAADGVMKLPFLITENHRMKLFHPPRLWRALGLGVRMFAVTISHARQGTDVLPFPAVGQLGAALQD